MSAVYYVANADCSEIKIGYSSNLDKRLYDLESAHGEIALLGWEPGSKDIERARHTAFNNSRLHGEWFAASDELIAFVRSLPTKVLPKEGVGYLTIRNLPVSVCDRLKEIAKARRTSVNSLCINTLEEMVTATGKVVQS